MCVLHTAQHNCTSASTSTHLYVSVVGCWCDKVFVGERVCVECFSSRAVLGCFRQMQRKLFVVLVGVRVQQKEHDFCIINENHLALTRHNLQYVCLRYRAGLHQSLCETK